MMDAQDRLPAEEGHGERSKAKAHAGRWQGEDPFDWEIGRYAKLDSEGARPTYGFANTLRPRPLPRISEEVFEQIAIERSEAAFSEFYEGLAPKVYSFVFRLLRVEDDALDVLQDTFTEVWNRAPILYNIHTNLAAWALHLARNIAVDLFRSNHYQTRRITESFEPLRHEGLMMNHETPEQEMTLTEARLEIKNAIEKLSPEQRKSIELVFFADLTQKAAAEKLHLPYARFQSIYYESLTELEHELFPYLHRRQAPEHQTKLKREAVVKKRGKLLRKKEAKEDATSREDVLRRFVLGIPFSDGRTIT